MYVKEAYRLLQKSIIFVETEDIELEDNEEEMNQLSSETSKCNVISFYLTDMSLLRIRQWKQEIEI